jgi:hypothetical protein
VFTFCICDLNFSVLIFSWLICFSTLSLTAMKGSSEGLDIAEEEEEDPRSGWDSLSLYSSIVDMVLF